jgi:hypothetical protein
MCHIYSTQFIIMYTSWVRPFSEPKDSTREIINEILVLVASYNLFVFTDWGPDLETQFQFGWILISIIVFTIALNICFMVSGTISILILKAKLKVLRY